MIAAHTLSPQTSIPNLIAASAIVMFATSVPISLAGWGMREMSAVVGLGAIGVPAHAALTAAVMIGIGALLVVGVFAAISLPEFQGQEAAGPGPIQPIDRLLSCAGMGASARRRNACPVSDLCSGAGGPAQCEPGRSARDPRRRAVYSRLRSARAMAALAHAIYQFGGHRRHACAWRFTIDRRRTVRLDDVGGDKPFFGVVRAAGLCRNRRTHRSPGSRRRISDDHTDICRRERGDRRR